MDPKVAIVTGAGSGIGRAVSVGFAQHGWAVVAVGRDRSKLEATAELVAQSGGKCLVHAADVAVHAAMERLAGAAVDRFGRVDVLVNNAGFGPRATIDDLDVATFDKMLAVNAAGVFYACKSVWPVMKRQGGGTIVNISSMAAADPFPGLGIYGATKAFVNALTRGLAAEGKAHGILVFGIGPGAVETDMLRGAFPDLSKDKVLAPSAIAEMVLAMTDPVCRYSTGQTIYVRK
jgi:NAD(P)-dependent dehydrogenase (short-subunit alcohol dehydrogenase family)